MKALLIIIIILLLWWYGVFEGISNWWKGEGFTTCDCNGVKSPLVNNFFSGAYYDPKWIAGKRTGCPIAPLTCKSAQSASLKAPDESELFAMTHAVMTGGITGIPQPYSGKPIDEDQNGNDMRKIIARGYDCRDAAVDHWMMSDCKLPAPRSPGTPDHVALVE